MTFDSLVERNKFIESNLPLVADRVRKRNKGIFDDDLYQVGSLALINAVDRFDKERGNEFSTYAVSYIDGRILKYKRYDTLIKPLQEKGKWNFSYKDIGSLDVPIGNDGVTVGDTICGHNNLEKNVIEDIFTNAFLSSLSERERRIINLRLKGMLQKNISQATDIKQSKVSIIIKRIRKKYLNYIADTM